jgi:transcriptional antiterminator
MKELLSKKDHRQLTLIEILYRSKGWRTLSELSEELGCSLRILKDDVHDIDEEQDDFDVQTSYQGVKLVFKPNKGIQSVYQDFLLRSKAYDLFQLIYTNENYSTEELAQLLFVSTSTLRRLIKKAREYLKKEYDISIHINPYHDVSMKSWTRFDRI